MNCQWVFARSLLPSHPSFVRAWYCLLLHADSFRLTFEQCHWPYVTSSTRVRNSGNLTCKERKTMGSLLAERTARTSHNRIQTETETLPANGNNFAGSLRKRETNTAQTLQASRSKSRSLSYRARLISSQSFRLNYCDVHVLRVDDERRAPEYECKCTTWGTEELLRRQPAKLKSTQYLVSSLPTSFRFCTKQAV